jgi:hypothetical protein
MNILSIEEPQFSMHYKLTCNTLFLKASSHYGRQPGGTESKSVHFTTGAALSRKELVGRRLKKREVTEGFSHS